MESRRGRRGEVAKRGSLVAVTTADASRAELFRVFISSSGGHRLENCREKEKKQNLTMYRT